MQIWSDRFCLAFFFLFLLWTGWGSSCSALPAFFSSQAAEMLAGHQRQSLLFVLLLQKRVQKEGNPTTDSTMPCSPLLFRRMQTAEEGVIQPPSDHTHGGLSNRDGSAIGTLLLKAKIENCHTTKPSSTKTAIFRIHHNSKPGFLGR